MLHLDDRLRNGRSHAALVLSVLAICGHGYVLPARAQGAPPPNSTTPATEPAWKSSPFHGVIGGDGTVIPCRCLFRGTAYRLGEKVCMQTHVGTVITECDLQQNNTSWVPTGEACVVS
ncbi:MAG: hypothetical protein ABL904_03895 [Hyphomicrobiaceae bacterium]